MKNKIWLIMAIAVLVVVIIMIVRSLEEPAPVFETTTTTTTITSTTTTTTTTTTQEDIRYEGVTPGAYNGPDIGVGSGGSAKCAIAFPGSYMCGGGEGSDLFSKMPDNGCWYKGWIDILNVNVGGKFATIQLSRSEEVDTYVCQRKNASSYENTECDTYFPICCCTIRKD